MTYWRSVFNTGLSYCKTKSEYFLNRSKNRWMFCMIMFKIKIQLFYSKFKKIPSLLLWNTCFLYSIREKKNGICNPPKNTLTFKTIIHINRIGKECTSGWYTQIHTHTMVLYSFEMCSNAAIVYTLLLHSCIGFAWYILHFCVCSLDHQFCMLKSTSTFTPPAHSMGCKLWRGSLISTSPLHLLLHR